MTTPSTRLASAALGVFDVITPRVLDGIRKGTHRSARVTVSPTALRELLAALDGVRPGLVDEYVRLHREL